MDCVVGVPRKEQEAAEAELWEGEAAVGWGWRRYLTAPHLFGVPLFLTGGVSPLGWLLRGVSGAGCLDLERDGERRLQDAGPL